MRQEYINKLNNCNLGFYVNLELSDIDNEVLTNVHVCNNEDGDLSADDFDHVDYYIKDGKLLSWSNDEIMDLDDLEDSWFEDAMNDEDSPMTWFECVINELMNHVIQNELTGDYEFRNLIDEERILLVLLKDEDDNIIEEIDDWNIIEHVD